MYSNLSAVILIWTNKVLKMSNKLEPLDLAQVDKTSSSVDILVQKIKTYISEYKLKVGDTLPSERDLGKMFGSARNTVREAIRILKAYGVIDVKPKVGAIIVNRHMDAALDLFSFQITMSHEIFTDIQGFRRLVEIGLVDQLFENLTNTNLLKLHKINDAILLSRSPSESAQFDFNFHSTMLSYAGNDTVLAVYNTMKSIILRLMETGKHEDGLLRTHEQHLLILNMLKNRDRLGFKYHMSAHFDQGLKYIKRTPK